MERAANEQRIAAADRPYLEQADAVARQARRLDTAQSLTRRTGERHRVVGDTIYRKVERPIFKDYWTPVTAKGKLDIGKAHREDKLRKAVVAAPALKVLDQTTRPVHAVAAAAKEDVKAVKAGKSPIGNRSYRAAVRGAQLKDRTLFSDVLKEAGVKNKAVRGVVGGVLDVGLDPTTYLTGGTGAVAKRAAVQASRDAARQAVRAGVGEQAARTAEREAARKAARRRPQSREQVPSPREAGEAARRTAVQQVAQRAARRAEEAAPRGRGVTLRVAGAEVPGVRRATGAVARGTRKATRRVVGDRIATQVPAAARNVVRNVAPRVRAPGLTHEQHTTARAIARESRATRTVGASRAQMLELLAERNLSPKDHALVADALDRGNLSKIMGDKHREALRKAKGDRRKANDLHRQADAKDFERRQKLAQTAHEIRSELGGRRALRAGARPKQREGEFLTSGDLRRLRQTIKAEPRAQARRVAQLERHEQRARGRAELAEQEAALRHQGAERVAETRAADAARVKQVQLTGRARTETERVRGGEQRRAAVQTERARGQAQVQTVRAQGQAGKQAAVERQQLIARTRQAHADAKRRLKAELAKPVHKRRGVAVLETRVDRTRAEWQAARRPAQPAAVERVAPRAVEPAAPVSAIRPRLERAEREAAPRTVGRREGQAAERFERRAADVQLAQRRQAAAESIPRRGARETQSEYLERLVRYATHHDLPLVRRRAEGLLARKPAERARGYFPREVEDRLADRLTSGNIVTRLAGVMPESTPGVGRIARGAAKTTAGHQRQDVRPLEVVNRERVGRGDKPFSTNVPLTVGNHLREAARSTSGGEFAQNMAAALGRTVKAGEKVLDGEDLYRVGWEGGTFRMHKIPSRKAPSPLVVKPGETVRAGTPPIEVPRGGRGGQYVAMPSGIFEKMEASLAGTGARSNNELLQMFDAAQSGWKRAAIATLAFHIRNIIGDIAHGYFMPGVGGSWRGIPAATRLTARSSQQARLLRPPTLREGKDTIRVAGEQVNIDSFLKEARDNGVLDVGIVAREVRGIEGQSERKLAPGRLTKAARQSRLAAAGRTMDRWVTNRENLMRLAAYKSARDRGMNPREAADMANLFHIDYGELSPAERAFFRRAMPFYTWTARTLPVIGLTLVQRPGKIANFEKVREEIGQAFTGQDEEQQRARTPGSVARNLPFTIRVAGSDFGVSASLPITLINEVPAGKDLGAYLDEISHFGAGMISPWIKGPAELYFNRSAFTKRDIESKDFPTTDAPSWIALAPQWIKDMTHAEQARDGTWKWRGRADWWSHQAPGLPQQISSAASGGRPGQEKLPPVAGAVSQLSGVRLDKIGTQTVKRAQGNRLRAERDRLEFRAKELNNLGITSANATPEYRALRKRINALNKTLNPRPKRRAAGGGGGGYPGFGGGGGTTYPGF